MSIWGAVIARYRSTRASWQLLMKHIGRRDTKHGYEVYAVTCLARVGMVGLAYIRMD